MKNKNSKYMPNKIIRSICFYTNILNEEVISELEQRKRVLEENNFEVQTTRISSKNITVSEFDNFRCDDSILLSVGTLSMDEINSNIDALLITKKDISFNIDLSREDIGGNHVKILFDIIKNNPSKTFNFCYVFNNKNSSPFFPAGNFEKEGFSIGLQLTDLSENCNSLEEWFGNISNTLKEVNNIFKDDNSFLGIDNSIAPFADGKGSLIDFINRLGHEFNYSVLTNVYLNITNFLKNKNPKPVGLRGLMFPCLEDFVLANEYEKGNFSIERNIFLSLHSGLGIDIYPIGIDEKQEKVINILKTVQGLSNKYNKPLSCRFVSDGKTEIGEKSNFGNQYLKDVVIRRL